MKTRFLRFSKSAIIAAANSVRIPVAFEARFVRQSELVEGELVLSVVHGQVVAIHRVLHGADAVTLDGIGNDGDGNVVLRENASALGARGQKGSEIVTGDAHDVKAEGAELCIERFERHHLFGTPD